MRSYDAAMRPSSNENPLREILARIELVKVETTRQRRATNPRARKYTEKEWCKAAKVSPSYIAAIRRRGPDGTDEASGVSAVEFGRLAAVAGVEVGWLLGEGPRLPVRRSGGLVTLPAPPPSTQAAQDNLAVAIAEYVYPIEVPAAQAVEVGRRVRAEADLTGSSRALSVRFWTGRITHYLSQVRSERSGTRAKIIE